MNPFLLRRIRGPVFLLCFALTAILAQWDILSFARSWPLYLLTAGLLRLLEFALPFGAGAIPGQGPGQGWMQPFRSRPSLTGALVLLTVGVVALLLTTGAISSGTFFHLYSGWWPLILVLVGILLLLERLFDRGYSQRPGTVAYGSRRRRGGGLVSLVVLLVLLGVVSRVGTMGNAFGSHRFGHWSPDWTSDWTPDWNFGGETHEKDFHVSQPIGADATLAISNAHGDLEIAPSTDGMLHVTAHQQAHVSDSDKERVFRETQPVVSVHGSSGMVTVPETSGGQVDLVLGVPAGVLCTVSNHHGDIAITGLAKTLEIRQDHGDVALDSLGGPVHLVMDHGDVRARALASDLQIEGRADDVTAAAVHGRTTLRGDFLGDTEIDGAGGPVEFSSNRTQLVAEHLAGQLSLDSGDLRLAGVSGGLKLHTRSKDVKLTNLSGDAELDDSNGDISVSGAKSIGALHLTDDTGDVTLSLAPGTSFSFHGVTNADDDVDSAFALASTDADGLKTISGQVGQGGPHIEVTVMHGDLNLHRGSGETERAEAPEPPEHGHSTKPVRHLQSTGEPPAPVSQ